MAWCHDELSWEAGLDELASANFHDSGLLGRLEILELDNNKRLASISGKEETIP